MAHSSVGMAAAVLLIYSLPVHGQRTDTEITELLTKTSTALFERAKAKQTPDSASLLRDLIGEAASRLVSDKKTSDREVSAVVEILKRFASEMVKRGVRQPDGTLRVGEDAFAAAQRSLCPLYPFC